ncbi:hypothetical protein FE784_02215 [Paenibacillus hemerocallicola]|uniref:Neutral/alkaline non-lysosomal ceramidase N-terminal domain-containing protein n=1 Tax=Paenibacillus hemerocallicola TaxID=1172614 RepID=A0A5C4TFQ1_9BACL|nr:hypothetical protein [Paenibacillus hemerocallicola]TNJ67974.1 hypothetical protein FE784_02215 [Paenibacillus hemerocallicola]
MNLRAGVAKIDITTGMQGVVISDPLYAKALVLDDGSTKAVIVAMDALAIGGLGDIKDDFMPKLRRRIENELHIPGGSVMVNASHTHPQGRLLCDDAEQVDRTFEAVRQAMGAMAEVRVGWGVGHEDRIVVNRNLKMKDGKHWSIRYAHPCPPDEDVSGIGPIDPDIGVIRIDRLDGQPLAVVYNFACHLLIGVPDRGVTANFPGFASKVIEETLGNGAMALFLQGAGGDILELYFKDVNRPRNCEPIGTMLGLAALRAARRIETGNARLSVLSETIRLPRRVDIPERIAERLRDQAELLAAMRSTALNFKTFLPMYLKYALHPDYPSDYGYRYMQEAQIGANELVAMDAHNRGNIERYLGNIHKMEKLIRIQEDVATLKHHLELNEEAGEPDIPAEVQGIKIGDGVLITAPAELLIEVGLKLKASSPYEHTIISAFTNGYMHYAPPVEHYGKGGYEVTECLLAPEWQRAYEDKANEIIRRL